ncbi:hypothetical protein [Enterococcus gilvus]|uniref:hypothetical protein n=1 Tax=Enterococcus gilvus TaxID=160453 RepID=UPI003EDB06A6
MNSIELVSTRQFSTTSKNLKDELEKKRKFYQNLTTYSNTEASLLWIIRGCIDYFDMLDDGFLGEGNDSGIPDIKADRFANNFYRLNNSIDYLARLWKLKIEKSNNLKLLLDIRTLIVHSGEQITKIESLGLKGYKDSQLGRIFNRKGRNSFYFVNEFSDMDYCIQVWGDKHDNTKNHNLSKVDHHIENESYKDIEIYLKATDVREIVLCFVESFINYEAKSKVLTEMRGLPDTKDNFIDQESDIIDFNKIANLISKDLRGGYFKENNVEHWNGFGLERLYEYSQKRLNISEETRKIVKERIYRVMSKYWDDYQDESVTDDELPDLDIMKLFSDFIPEINLGNGKIFNHIAPFFNIRNQHDATDIDYLFKLIIEMQETLGHSLCLEQTVDGLLCDYVLQSIQAKFNS